MIEITVYPRGKRPGFDIYWTDELGLVFDGPFPTIEDALTFVPCSLADRAEEITRVVKDKPQVLLLNPARMVDDEPKRRPRG